jgi:glutamate dehydrogenase/leucine dehydrogenase
MREVHAATRFASCIPPELGGSGDPSAMTAAGVVCAMEAALAFAERPGLEGATVVLQGTGRVGSALLPLLFDRRVARVVASELSEERRAALLDAFEGQPLELRAAEPGGCEILSEPCDVLAPCALGGSLGPKTIPGIRAAIVCGAANNQLLDDERDGRALFERGILCVPDYIANRMGIVACGNEQYGYVRDDPAVRRHLDRDWPEGIFRSTLRVLEAARSAGESPMAAANRWADARAGEPHPIWGHRARQIVDSLLADRWELS